MKITMSDIRKRIQYLPKSSFNESKMHYIVEQSMEVQNVNRAMQLLESSCKDVNNSVPINTVLNLYDIIYEMGTPSQINSAAREICLEYVARTRNAKDTQTNIRRKMGKAKSNIGTRIEKNFNDAEDAVKKAIGGVKSNFKKNTDQIKTNVQSGLKINKDHKEKLKPEIDKKEPSKKKKKNTINPSSTKSVSPKKKSKQEMKDEAYIDGLTEMDIMATKMIHCDRIIENYNRISKRFNIDKIIQENTPANGIADTTIEICRLLDTYDINEKLRYNTVLETCWYGFQKNAMDYNQQEMVTAATDYYFYKGDNYYMCSDLLENSLVVSKQDYVDDDLELITEEEPEEEEYDDEE